MLGAFTLFAACVLWLAGAWAPLHAAAGGSGGSPFALRCDGNEVLVGADGTTGWYVDEIFIRCTELNADGSWRTGGILRGGAGLPGNIPYALRCQDGEIITAIAGGAGAYVDSMALGCVPVDGSAPGAFTSAVGGGGGSSYTEACTDGAAVGIRGRADWWIDQIEIICAGVALPPPDGIELIAPAANAQAPSLQPTFSWAPVPENALGVSYQLCLDVPGGPDCEFETSGPAREATPAQPLDFQGQPFAVWQVRGCTTRGCSEWARRWLAAPADVGIGGVNIAAPLCEVYKDPRCSNCHGGFSHNVGTNCVGCHAQAIHPETEQAVWLLAPTEQRFADPATCGDICRVVRRWAEDHVGEPHDFPWHVQNDPLVRWGFEPVLPNGPATPVQEMDHAGYVDLSLRWYRAGMPCDPENDQFGPLLAAGAAGPDGGGVPPGPPPREFPRPPKLEPPKTEPVWWLKPPAGEPDHSKLAERTGVPPECRVLIGQPHPKTLSDLRRQLPGPEFLEGRRIAELERLCKGLVERPRGK